jgi:hypothetical protein
MLPDDEPRLCGREFNGAFYQTVEYLLQIESRTADGFENPGGRGLSSMRLCQLSLQISIRTRNALMRMLRS